MKAHLFAAIGSSTKSSFVYVEACKYSMYYYLYVYKKQMNGSHAVLFRFRAEATKYIYWLISYPQWESGHACDLLVWGYPDS